MRDQSPSTSELSPGHRVASAPATGSLASNGTYDDGPLAVLRRWRRTRPVSQRCELCGGDLASEHEHVFEPAARNIFCACHACAILFDAPHLKFRRIPRRVCRLPGFRCDDLQWENLNLPIDLAFFFTSSQSGRVMALYPSPAGAVEAAPSDAVWQDLIEANPELPDWEPDVEALLVNRVAAANDWYLAPIDECFKLVGVLRGHWRGLSGGTRVWGEIDKFFQDLNSRCL